MSAEMDTIVIAPVPKPSSLAYHHIYVLSTCLTHQIVPAAPQYKYAAPSYVWGNSKFKSTFPVLPKRLPESLRTKSRLSDILECNISGLIDITLISTTRMIKIGTMDLVYTNAEVTRDRPSRGELR
jgi:hypothetical protein